MSRLQRDVEAVTTMPLVDLRESWAKCNDEAVPAVPQGLLRRLVAQRLQEKRLGALPVLVARELERISGGGATEEVHRPVVALTPGTRLVREWNGQTISVEVLEKGYRWSDKTWRSLSEIAKTVTGAHWSGPRFFGLHRRG